MLIIGKINVYCCVKNDAVFLCSKAEILKFLCGFGTINSQFWPDDPSCEFIANKLNNQMLRFIISPCYKMHTGVFQIVLRGSRGIPPLGGMGNFAGGRVFFLLGGGYLRRSDFDHLYLFQN